MQGVRTIHMTCCQPGNPIRSAVLEMFIWGSSHRYPRPLRKSALSVRSDTRLQCFKGWMGSEKLENTEESWIAEEEKKITYCAPVYHFRNVFAFLTCCLFQSLKTETLLLFSPNAIMKHQCLLNDEAFFFSFGVVVLIYIELHWIRI